MATTFRAWLKTVASALGDAEPGHEFQRYTLTNMIAAYNAALCLIQRYRPDWFTEVRQVKLTTGRYQDVRSCCANVLDVLEQVDANGNSIRLLHGARDKRTTAKRLWKKMTCLPIPAGQTFVLTNVDIDKNLNGRFTVEPPVPCQTNVYVRIKCVTQPCVLTEAGIDNAMPSSCIYATAAWHYVLATMLAGDQFASAAAGGKNFHYQLFFNLLGAVQKQEAQIESREEA